MNLIVTKELNGGIRRGNRVPWFLPNEREYFDHITQSDGKNILIMGRHTWESLNYISFKNRFNIVISTKIDYINGIQTNPELFVRSSLKDAIFLALSMGEAKNIWFIGGRSVFEYCYKYCKRIFIIDVHAQFYCDVFFPKFNLDYFAHISEKYSDDNGLIFSKHIYEKYINLNEEQYLELVKQVLEEGNKKIDRTQCGTLSIFGATCRYDLSENKMPLLTTKKMFWRGIVEELLWFIKGDTNNTTLTNKNINIWTPNAIYGNDLGPIYGFQWRHFGAKYKDCYTNYTGQGKDQLLECIDNIKNNPSSRRILMIAWNPVDNPNLILPPCHCLVQFYVNGNELSSMVYQRSGDLGLGIPFNIASYALLTHMIAALTNLQAEELIHVIGDAHIYNNHIAPLQEQLLRCPNQCPSIEFKKIPQTIEEFSYEDIILKNYSCYESVDMQISV